jgi:hypothetical protein
MCVYLDHAHNLDGSSPFITCTSCSGVAGEALHSNPANSFPLASREEGSKEEKRMAVGWFGRTDGHRRQAHASSLRLGSSKCRILRCKITEREPGRLARI